MRIDRHVGAQTMHEAVHQIGARHSARHIANGRSIRRDAGGHHFKRIRLIRMRHVAGVLAIYGMHRVIEIGRASCRERV